MPTVAPLDKGWLGLDAASLVSVCADGGTTVAVLCWRVSACLDSSKSVIKLPVGLAAFGAVLVVAGSTNNRDVVVTVTRADGFSGRGELRRSVSWLFDVVRSRKGCSVLTDTSKAPVVPALIPSEFRDLLCTSEWWLECGHLKAELCFNLSVVNPSVVSVRDSSSGIVRVFKLGLVWDCCWEPTRDREELIIAWIAVQ